MTFLNSLPGSACQEVKIPQKIRAWSHTVTVGCWLKPHLAVQSHCRCPAQADKVGDMLAIVSSDPV